MFVHFSSSPVPPTELTAPAAADAMMEDSTDKDLLRPLGSNCLGSAVFLTSTRALKDSSSSSSSSLFG